MCDEHDKVEMTEEMSSGAERSSGFQSLLPAAAGAIARTAVQEHPNASWRSYLHSPLASPGSHSDLTQLPSDAFGLAESGGVAYRQRMLPVASIPDKVCSPVSLAVVGGTGAIGALIGIWSAQDPMCHVTLLGRSGRGTGAVLSAAIGMVTIVRCDASTAEEAGAALQVCRRNSAPLDGIMHAGGVLRDAPLAKHTLASFREVYLPFKCKALWWLRSRVCHRLAQLDSYNMGTSTHAGTGA